MCTSSTDHKNNFNYLMWFWPASSLICGNKIPTRCNRGFYCRSYCLLNMFRASLCPSSGAQEYYTVVAACGNSCCGFSSSWSGVELRVMRPVCRMLVYKPLLHLVGILFPHINFNYIVKIISVFFYFLPWPTNTQLFHKLSHFYMFRHYRVILREIVINTSPSYTSISNAN